jgi:hypothetical protein
VWGKEEVRTGLWWENLRERDHLEDLYVDVLIILKWMIKKWGTDWIELAQDRDRCRALVNAVMKLRIP